MCIISYIKEISENIDREIDEPQSSVSTIETRLANQKEQIDENSAQERKDTLIMAGTLPPARYEENTKSIVREQN